MKHLKRIFESNENIPDNIMDNFLGVTDTLGEPKVEVTTFKDGSVKYRLKWIINATVPKRLDFDTFFNNYITPLNNLKHDFLSAKNRLKNYHMEITFHDYQNIEVEIKSTPTGKEFIERIEEYNTDPFYVDYDDEGMYDGAMYLNKKNIIDFFASKGLKVKEFKFVDERRWLGHVGPVQFLQIDLDEYNHATIKEFLNKFELELEKNKFEFAYWDNDLTDPSYVKTAKDLEIQRCVRIGHSYFPPDSSDGYGTESKFYKLILV